MGEIPKLPRGQLGSKGVADYRRPWWICGRICDRSERCGARRQLDRLAEEPEARSHRHDHLGTWAWAVTSPLGDTKEWHSPPGRALRCPPRAELIAFSCSRGLLREVDRWKHFLVEFRRAGFRADCEACLCFQSSREWQLPP